MAKEQLQRTTRNSITMNKILVMGMAVLLVAGIFMAILPDLAYAQVPNVPAPSGAVRPGGETGIRTVFSQVARILAIFATGILVITIIWGALSYMLAGGDPEKAKSARTVLINGVIGALILFGIAFIIGLIFDVSQDIFGVGGGSGSGGGIPKP
jgi:uncharacterized membrane protein